MAVVDDGVQPPDVARLARIEQRHRDAARIQSAEERDEVFEVLRAEDGHPVAGLGHLLKAGADRTVAPAEVGPVQISGDAVALRREVQEPVGELVSTDLGPPLDVKNQASAVGKLDLSVFDERVMEPHHTLLSTTLVHCLNSRGPRGTAGAFGLRCPHGRRASNDVTEASASIAAIPFELDFPASRLLSVLVVS